MSAATATIIAGVAIAATATTTVVSAKMASGAAADAAKAQKESTDTALGYEKERDKYARETEANRYGSMMKQTEPYRRTGTSANTRMADLLGLPPEQSGQVPTQQEPWRRMMDGSGGPATGGPGSAGASWAPNINTPGPARYGEGVNTAASDANMVLMRAPNGQTKHVPNHEVQHWQSKGAVLVPGGGAQ